MATKPAAPSVISSSTPSVSRLEVAVSASTRIYLDYHATTPVDPRVGEMVMHYFAREFGNASSADHSFGDEADRAVYRARSEVAQLLDARPEQVVFTSGATESINVALQGFVNQRARQNGRIPHVAVSAVEHRAVLETARALEKAHRLRLTIVPVDGKAHIDLDFLRSVATRSEIDLVCVMAANNEVGTVYPVNDIGLLADSVGAAFLCDATQAAGKLPLSIRDARVTFLALSAHKIYGPMGIGALVLRNVSSVDPILFGGGHERSVRPGTLNVPGIVGLGEACRLRRLEMCDDEARISELRDALQNELLSRVDGLVINGSRERLPGNLHVSVPDVPNGAVIARVRECIAIATGAACTSGIESPSHVLKAMGLSLAHQEGALRIGLGKFTTAEEVNKAAVLIGEAVRDARRVLRA